jgi:predicted alpha/beta-hydrolase family hydrolase
VFALSAGRGHLYTHGREEGVAEIPVRIDRPEGRGEELSIVLAHGAGAAMDSPYMQEYRKTRKRTRPDPPSVLEDCWIRVVEQVGPAPRLVIGGKSMGGRIASMVADRLGVRGLVCMGYPFHPAGRPGVLRVSHLKGLATPTLILQGERDALGSREETASYALSPSIRVVFLPDGDHSFKPRKSSGRTYEQNLAQAIEETLRFCRAL